MGCDIHSFAEVKRNDKWEMIEEEIFPFYEGFDGDNTTEPFYWRSYFMFEFLAGVRNYDGIEPISLPKGFPKDSEYLNSKSRYDDSLPTIFQEILYDDYYHSLSYLTLRELIEYDYNKTYFSKLRQVIFPLKESLGENYFKHLEILKGLGNPDDVRIVIYFDN